MTTNLRVSQVFENNDVGVDIGEPEYEIATGPGISAKARLKIIDDEMRKEAQEARFFLFNSSSFLVNEDLVPINGSSAEWPFPIDNLSGMCRVTAVLRNERGDDIEGSESSREFEVT